MEKVGRSLSNLIIGCMIASFVIPGALGTIEGSEKHYFESLSVVVIEGEQTMSGIEAYNMRFGIDALGNNNSVVEIHEVTDFEALYENYVKETTNEYTLNGITGNFTDIVCTFKNAAGPVNGTASLILEFQGRVRFAAVDTGLESYKYRVVNEGGDIETMMEFQLTVPSGYSVTNTEGIILPDYSATGRTVAGSTLVDLNIVVDFGVSEDDLSWLWLPVVISIVMAVVGLAVYFILKNYTGLLSDPPDKPPQDEEF
jgi:hypothetical protein